MPPVANPVGSCLALTIKAMPQCALEYSSTVPVAKHRLNLAHLARCYRTFCKSPFPDSHGFRSLLPVSVILEYDTVSRYRDITMLESFFFFLVFFLSFLCSSTRVPVQYKVCKICMILVIILVIIIIIIIDLIRLIWGLGDVPGLGCRYGR